MKTTFRWRVAQKAELQWWKRYLNSKSKASYLAWKKEYWQTLLSKLQTALPIDKLNKVLDAGCGPAGIFIALPNQEVDAIDPLLTQYSEHFEHFVPKDYENVSFQPTSLEQLTDNQKYDVVFCMNAINHVSNIDLCMDNLVNAAKGDSYVVVTIDAHNNNFFKKLFRAMPFDILHPHQYDLAEYKDMLEDRGCEITACVELKKAFFFNHYVIVAKTWH